MGTLFDASVAIRDFMELGGPVLSAIAVAIFVMWVLIVERVIYFRTTHKHMVEAECAAWEARAERRSWFARQSREAMISRVKVAANGPIPLIKTLVALCPLLGLMGTVTGMIEVFDVLAISGTGNARSSGVFAATILGRIATKETERLDEILELDTIAEIEPTPARLRFTREEELPREERSEEVA